MPMGWPVSEAQQQYEVVYEVVAPIPAMGAMPGDTLVVEEHTVHLVRDLGPIPVMQHHGRALRWLQGVGRPQSGADLAVIR